MIDFVVNYTTCSSGHFVLYLLPLNGAIKEMHNNGQE